MKTCPPTGATLSPGNVGVPLPLQGSRRMPTRTTPGRAPSIDAGAIEYASWLLLPLPRRRAP